MARSDGTYDGTGFDLDADAGFYPVVALGSDGVQRVTVTARLYARADLNALKSKVSRVDWIVPLGTTKAVPWMQAGAGPLSLTIPVRGGRTTTFGSAYLESVDNVRGVATGGSTWRDWWSATLTFAIDGPGSV